MDAGFLNLTAFGTGSNGGKVRASFYFPTDPGYRDTARFDVDQITTPKTWFYIYFGNVGC